LQELEDYEDLG
jgi:hypothetical protein